MFKPGKNISRVRAEIHRAAQAAGRNANTIMLVAVSKGQPVEAIAAAAAAGGRDFGENQVQEALKKIAVLSTRTSAGISSVRYSPIKPAPSRSISTGCTASIGYPSPNASRASARPPWRRWRFACK
jgi:hypothetical protein